MRALVLSAGRGSRMGPHTDDRPKCLITIAGRSLLDRQTAALTAAGADPVGVVTGWHSTAFTSIDVPTFFNPHWATTTMVGSLAVADQWLRAGPVLVSYGDIVYSADTVRRLAACTAPLAISYDPDWERLWNRRFTRPLEDAETFVRDGAGNLVEIGGRPGAVEQVQGQYVGLLRFTPEAWSVVRQVRSGNAGAHDLDMTGLLRLLVRERLLPVATVPVDGPWCEFDHPSDLRVGIDIVRQLDEGDGLCGL